MPARLRLEDFPDWTSYYWEYQHRLAREFLIPCLKGWGSWQAGIRILDVGCGDGGASCALAEAGAEVFGLDLDERRLTGARSKAALRGVSLELHVADITDPSTLGPFKGPYELILYRDVLEHIPQRGRALAESRARLSAGGGLVVIFPPYLSAFGQA